MKHLSKAQVLQLHTMLLAETGGLDGVRDVGLLESALRSPFQTFAGMDLYPSIYAKAAQLGFALINNHPFVDGNKRIGLLVMLTFLELNGVVVNCTEQELIHLGLELARGKVPADNLLQWIMRHET